MIKLTGHVLHLLSSENLCELVYTHISNQESYFSLSNSFWKEPEKSTDYEKENNPIMESSAVHRY